MQLLLRVARMYYEEDRTQADIAREIGYSRPTVSRMLTLAREMRIVKVSISHPLERILAVEKRLLDALPLTAIRVSEPDGGDPIESIGAAAAELLVETIKNGQVLAVGNGRSVAAAARHVPATPREDCTVVQILGSMTGGLPEWGRDSPTITTHIAQQFGATAARMSVPLIMDDPDLLRALMREERIATTLALASRADIALVGVAGVQSYGAGNILADYLTPSINRAIRESGAVGHILDRHFDAHGNEVHTPLTDRTFSLPLSALTTIPTVMAVAAGDEKAEAILTAIQGGIVDALVTDYPTAKALLHRL